jgi:serine/threonine-protein kinase
MMRERNPSCEVPEAVEALVRRMLEKNVEHRVQSMDAFLKEVRALQEAVGPILAPGLFVSGQTGTYPISISGATTSGPSTSGAVLASASGTITPPPRAVEPDAPSSSIARPASSAVANSNNKPGSGAVVALAVIGALASVAAVALATRGGARARDPQSTQSAPSTTPVIANAHGGPQIASPAAHGAEPDAGANALAASTTQVVAAPSRPSARPSTPVVRAALTRTTVAPAVRETTPSVANTPATTTTTAEAPGMLTLDTTPYSVVSEGGRVLGTTPLIRVPLPPGQHTLTLRNPEQNLSTTYTVTVRSGETVSRRLGLE